MSYPQRKLAPAPPRSQNEPQATDATSTGGVAPKRVTDDSDGGPQKKKRVLFEIRRVEKKLINEENLPAGSVALMDELFHRIDAELDVRQSIYDHFPAKDKGRTGAYSNLKALRNKRAEEVELWIAQFEQSGDKAGVSSDELDARKQWLQQERLQPGRGQVRFTKNKPGRAEHLEKWYGNIISLVTRGWWAALHFESRNALEIMSAWDLLKIEVVRKKENFNGKQGKELKGLRNMGETDLLPQEDAGTEYAEMHFLVSVTKREGEKKNISGLVNLRMGLSDLLKPLEEKAKAKVIKLKVDTSRLNAFKARLRRLELLREFEPDLFQELDETVEEYHKERGKVIGVLEGKGFGKDMDVPVTVSSSSAHTLPSSARAQVLLPAEETQERVDTKGDAVPYDDEFVHSWLDTELIQEIWGTNARFLD